MDLRLPWADRSASSCAELRVPWLPPQHSAITEKPGLPEVLDTPSLPTVCSAEARTTGAAQLGSALLLALVFLAVSRSLWICSRGDLTARPLPCLPAPLPPPARGCGRAGLSFQSSLFLWE